MTDDDQKQEKNHASCMDQYVIVYERIYFWTKVPGRNEVLHKDNPLKVFR